MKILIPDTTGSNISQHYRNLLPNFRIRGIDHPEIVGDHPHGAWCGWNAAAPVQARAGNARHELVFLQLLSANGAAKHFQEILLETIAAEKPDYISMSWGTWDRQDELLQALLTMRWADFVATFKALRQQLGFVAFAAAGNDESMDAQPDVAHPQRNLPEDLFIIGSTNARGFPSEFSADGLVHGVLIGEQCISPDALGQWHLWRGTSATAPKACGVAASRGLTHAETLALIIAQAQHPPAWAERRPHPKWGYGSLEHLWQADMSWLDPSLRPPRHMRGIINTHALALDGIHE